ncbi:MAG: N-acetylglutaminylglutamine synthetase, partial [Pseudomonadota bacterium]
MSRSRRSQAQQKYITHRLRRMRNAYTQQEFVPGFEAVNEQRISAQPNAGLDLGWGRLIFAQTFREQGDIVEMLRNERSDQRDIVFYVRDPHVLLAEAPQEMFLDPSHTFRLDLSVYRDSPRQPRGFFIRRLSSYNDAEAVNTIYAARNMVPVSPDYFWSK